MRWDDSKRWARARKRAGQREKGNVRPCAMGQGDYDHDSISPVELSDLLGLTALSELAIDSIASENASCSAGEIEVAPLEIEARPAATPVECPASKSTDPSDSIDISPEEHSLHLESEFMEEGAGDTWQIDLPFDVADEEIISSPPDIPFDVPDIDVLDESEPESDFVPEVSEEARARQLAIEFLKNVRELSSRHVGWIVDIILARRWSTAQRKVHEFIETGYSLRHIHVAFLLSETWRECDAFDEQFNEGIHGPSWMNQCSPRLTWLEAMQLVSFCGENAGIEDIIEFAEGERHTWRQSMDLIRRFARFKEYLLRYRIADEAQRTEGGWYRTLDPRDGRFFGGCANPEYTLECWEDELPTLLSSSVMSRRIFMGDTLDILIPKFGDGLHWLED